MLATWKRHVRHTEWSRLRLKLCEMTLYLYILVSFCACNSDLGIPSHSLLLFWQKKLGVSAEIFPTRAKKVISFYSFISSVFFSVANVECAAQNIKLNSCAQIPRTGKKKSHSDLRTILQLLKYGKHIST